MAHSTLTKFKIHRMKTKNQKKQHFYQLNCLSLAQKMNKEMKKSLRSLWSCFNKRVYFFTPFFFWTCLFCISHLSFLSFFSPMDRSILFCGNNNKNCFLYHKKHVHQKLLLSPLTQTKNGYQVQFLSIRRKLSSANSSMQSQIKFMVLISGLVLR